MAELSPGELSPRNGRCRDQSCKLAKVLNGGGEVELVSCTVRTSKAEPIETEDPFQVGEQHLDLLPGVARRDVGVGPGDVARNLTRVLMA